MSTQIPYHLRTNKNVERALFVDLIRRLSPHMPQPAAEYQYVGMGGPLLEDFSAIQSVFGCRKMISLEIDRHVLARQRFNLPHCRIELRKQGTEKFVENYVTTAAPMLAWFDHTKPNWKIQIHEACELIQKLPDFSIFKISLASHPSIWNPKGEKDKVLPARLARLKENFASFEPFEESDVTNENFHKTLFRIFKLAVAKTIPDSPARVCRPLASYSYNDGTRMITITVTVGPASGIDKMKKNSGLEDWPYANLSWDGPMDISIPELSIRERLSVEQLLPDATRMQLHSQLGVRFDESLAVSREMLWRYVKFARHVPHFGKITL